MAKTAVEFYKAWWSATVPHAWTKTRAIATALTILSALIVWKVPKLEPYRLTFSWAGPLAVLAVYVVYRAIRAPWTMHQQQVKAAKQAEEAQEKLRDQLRDHQDHQGLADALTEHAGWATHELLNRAPLNGAMPSKEWIAQARAWENDVRKTLERFKCNKQDIQAFERLNFFDANQFSQGFELSVGIMFARVNRLDQMTAAHKQKADALRLPPK